MADHKTDYCTLFASVFAFNWEKASDYFGVSKRTVVRWYDANQAPLLVVRHLKIMQRGYLPDSGIFADWSIRNDRIYTPWGSVCPADLEYIYQYKWAARQYQRLLRESPGKLSDSETRLQEAVLQAQTLLDALQGLTANKRIG